MAPTKVKAALIGAAGGIGAPLSLLLKQSPAITELALYDVVPAVIGVAADVSHVSTPSIVKGYTKDDDGLKKALVGADIVVIPAGVPRKPGMTRDDLFKINAGIVRDTAAAIAEHCPKAFICVISNPVNSTVPVVAETLKKAGVFDPKRLFGVTTLDVVRAETFAAEVLGTPTESPSFKVPVIGGHSGITIIPLLSQATPSLASLSEDQVKELTTRIQYGGDEVVKAKDGAGSATLSMAYAGYRFVEKVIAASQGKTGIVDYTYVYIKDDADGFKTTTATVGSELEYFSVPVSLGPNGVEKILPIGNVSNFEKAALAEASKELTVNINKGVEFIIAPKL